MANASPTRSLAGPNLAPGSSVTLAIPFAQFGYQDVGEGGRSSTAPTPASPRPASSPPPSATPSPWQPSSSRNASPTVDFGLTILEEVSNRVRLSRSPVVNILSGFGRHGHGREMRGDRLRLLRIRIAPGHQLRPVGRLRLVPARHHDLGHQLLHRIDPDAQVSPRGHANPLHRRLDAGHPAGRHQAGGRQHRPLVRRRPLGRQHQDAEGRRRHHRVVHPGCHGRPTRSRCCSRSVRCGSEG